MDRFSTLASAAGARGVSPRITAAGGLFERRLRWGPTWRGWLGLVLVCAGSGYAGLRCVHPFLAVDAPVDADVLIVEGWIPDYAVRQCASDVRAGRYRHVLTVGGPVTGVFPPVAEDDTHAYVAAKILGRLGLPAGSIEMVPTTTIDRDRTYHSALTLRRWLDTRQLSPRSLNVVTLGVHARRSRLLFEQALGPDVEVGIVSIENAEYDPGHWWRYSEGVKEVISEAAAYLYARFFFWPEPPKPQRSIRTS